jgi:hypothetical protein
MRNTPEAMSEKRARRVECHHYWIIESPDGPTSRGVCEYCGAEKEFDNSALYSSREEARSQTTEPSRSTDSEAGNNSDNS